MNKGHKANSDYQAVWEIVRQIPKGRVAAYGDIAKLTGLLGQARQVGYALHALPLNSDVPWHRVINSAGRISLPRASGHYARQRRLLEREGVVFKGGRVNLKEFGWLKSLDDGHRTILHPAEVRSAGRKSRGNS
ncbi:MAG: MGMT family protein [Bacteroidota bacterium]